MAQKVRTQRAVPARHDGEPLMTPERTARVAAFTDNPCDEGGYDQFCRDKHGQLCRFHQEFCHGPDYPCIDHLRHALAVQFLEEIAGRRQRKSS